MAELLSVAASVAGLLTAAKEISTGISKIANSRRNGSKEILEIRRTVDNMSSVVSQLQQLLLRRVAVSPDRASMILVEELVATLTACVMTFSDLHGCVRGLQTERSLSIVDSIRWATRVSEAKGYLQSLQGHQSSLTLMVTILTCQSADSASAAAAEVKDLVSKVLVSNELLAKRMSTLEKVILPKRMSDGYRDSASVFSQGIFTTQNSPTGEKVETPVIIQSPLFGFQFEPELNNCRVYQRCRGRTSNTFSIVSSARVSKAWSILSGISLSQISNIAIQSLPVSANELQNSEHYQSRGSQYEEHVYKLSSKTSRKDGPPVSRIARYPKLVVRNDGRKLYALEETHGEASEDLTLSTAHTPTSKGFESTNKRPILKLDTSNTSIIPHRNGSIIQQVAGNNKNYPAAPSRQQYSFPKFEDVPDMPRVKMEEDTLPTDALGDSTLTLFSNNGGLVFSSAVGIYDEEIHESNAGVAREYWLATSLSKYRPQEARFEAGYPYLIYERYQEFRVIGEKGHLWLARSDADHLLGPVGWIWKRHFSKLFKETIPIPACRIELNEENISHVENIKDYIENWKDS